ncbi:MAG: hypothetical protein AAGI52_08980 [Bacteroidota bacterium]
MSEPVFFIDRSLGKRFPNELEAAGFSVKRHADYFQHDIDDTVWIRWAAERGYYAMGKDLKIAHNLKEAHDVLFYGLGYFKLTGGQANHRLLIDNVIGLQERLRSFIGRHERPFMASVRRPSAPGKSGSIYLSRTVKDLPAIRKKLGLED